jgi:histidine triad (HIT) family protein
VTIKHDPDCIFCKIVAGKIPSRKVFEDDDMLVFHDIAPWAPVHVLVIPKEHVATMYELEERHAPLLGRMLSLAPKLMRDLGVTNGFRTLINTGEDGLQEVQHVHMHVIGGPRPWVKG